MQASKASVIDDLQLNDVHRDVIASIFRLSMFWTPDLQDTSTLELAEHVPFAMWLVDVLRPRRLVQVGIQTGILYSAMCHAVKRLGLDTACFAVGSWGDDREEARYRDLPMLHDPQYAHFSQFLRPTLGHTPDRFEPGTIDLLYVDDLSTYDAPQHHLGAWLSKLSPNAVMLFRSPNTLSKAPIVSRLWSAQAAERPYFAFDHGEGLGVLAVGCEYFEPLSFVFRAGHDQRLLDNISAIFATLGRKVRVEHQRRDFEDAPTQTGRELAVLRDTLSIRASQLASLRTTLAATRSEVHNLNRRLADFETTLSEIRTSTSWRITAPMRAATTALRRSWRKGIPAPDIADQAIDYTTWISVNDTLTQEDSNLIKSHIDAFELRPRLSIVMPVYNTDLGYLKEAIESITNQLYPHWELCIADDASTSDELHNTLLALTQVDQRIKLHFRNSNGGISACTNTALSMVTGDWVVLMDHDDTVAPHALYLVAEAVNRIPDVAIIYSDEDHIDGNGQRSNPFFKPDWDYDLFLGQNFISHLSAYRTDLIRKVGGFREGYEGSQDWEFSLRILEAASNSKVHHLPFILYHWRQTPQQFSSTSIAGAVDSARRAITEHLRRTDQDATVAPLGSSSFLKTTRNLCSPRPLVSIVIPTRDRRELLETCTDGLLTRTNYQPLEIVIVDNASTELGARRFLSAISTGSNVTVLRDEGPFNFSRLVNHGVAASSGQICVLLNNDVDVINQDWLEELVAHAVRPEVGAVGAKLYFPDDTVQHAGVILGVGGVAGHQHKFAPRSAHGYFSRLQLTHNLSCVTAACLAVRRSVYLEVGGFDETNLAVAFNDVDFCIRLRKAGYQVIWTPHAELYHHESVSRGSDSSAENMPRFAVETRYMTTTWTHTLLNDPYYNPNLSLDSENFELATTPRTKRPWLNKKRQVRDVKPALHPPSCVPPTPK